MPIDISAVNWVFVALMAAIAFISSLVGNIISFRNRFLGAILTGVIFAILFVVWDYYPHNLGLPIIKTIGMDSGVG
jgi:dolichyl-phosphate-mannose--protein O-mannosyl transferase